MPVNDALGTRMKKFYEEIPRTRLLRRTPVAIRIDGKAFHTFTRGFKRPFDAILMKSMHETMQYLCENIQGCVLGYTQSDEITLILIDYKKLDSDAWFDYEVEKLCSVSASMATMAFNKAFAANVRDYHLESLCTMAPQCVEIQKEQQEYMDTLKRAVEKGAMFDARCFNIPREEVTNLIYWRQLDATRNSIQMVGQAFFSHAELQEKSCNDIQDMLHEQRGINWNNYPPSQKRGVCCIKEEIPMKTVTAEVIEDMEFGMPQRTVTNTTTYRSQWLLDYRIPIFKGDGREYIERLIQPEEE